MHYSQSIDQSVNQLASQSVDHKTVDGASCIGILDKGEKVNPTYSRSEPEHGLLDPGPPECHIFDVSLSFNS